MFSVSERLNLLQLVLMKKDFNNTLNFTYNNYSFKIST